MGSIYNSTLVRNKPLTRKKRIAPKKSFWLRSKHPSAGIQPQKEKFGTFEKLKKHSKLRKTSKKRALQMKEYRILSPIFLGRPENRYCILCICRSARVTWTEAKDVLALPIHEGDSILQAWGVVRVPATEIHHRNSRNGRLLCYEPFLIPSCRGCRDFPHDFPSLARTLDVLCPAPEWGVFPG